MFIKSITFVATSTVAAILMSGPVFAAKVTLNNDAIAEISGNANDLTFDSNSNATVSLATGDNSIVPPAGNPWSDALTTGQSLDNVASDQPLLDTQVQQNIKGLNNALAVGSISQNAVVNNGGSMGDGLNVVGYAVLTRSKF